jgi:hypothetical protein
VDRRDEFLRCLKEALELVPDVGLEATESVASYPLLNHFLSRAS